MPDNFTTDVKSISEENGNKIVIVEVAKFTPVAGVIMAEERARARALVALGIADTITDVFTGDIQKGQESRLMRLTSVTDFKKVGSDYPERWEFTVVV